MPEKGLTLSFFSPQNIHAYLVTFIDSSKISKFTKLQWTSFFFYCDLITLYVPLNKLKLYKKGSHHRDLTQPSSINKVAGTYII